MISMLRKEACSVSFMILLTLKLKKLLGRLPYQGFSQSGQSDHSLKTGTLLDVDIHPDVRTLMEHKAFLSTWCRTYAH